MVRKPGRVLGPEACHHPDFLLHFEAMVTSRPKLLCVEDDATVLSSAERLLSGDFTFLSAHSKTEALKLLQDHPDVAIVLADHRLPDSSGLDLLATVKTQAPRAVRALFSGHVELSEVAAAINSSLLHRFILKPWDNEYFRLQMLEALANHSTLIERMELERLSTVDSVTQLSNHRYFQDRLRVEVERAARHNRNLSLAMIDIDHFKIVNDRFGHPVGDCILRACAHRIVDHVRGLDSVSRYGGEEFAIIMPDTNLESALIACERIRRAFAENEFIFSQLPPISITISIGISSLTSRSSTPGELISAADRALYQAKSQGRNQTVTATNNT